MKLNEQIIQAVSEAATVGVPEKFIYGELGIPERTWEEWKRRGREIEVAIAEEVQSLESLSVNEKLYLRFSQGLQKGFSAGVKAALGRIRSAGKRQWQAEAWYLERRWPHLFGRHERRQVDLDANVKSRSSVDVRTLSTETLEKIEQDLAVLDDESDD